MNNPLFLFENKNKCIILFHQLYTNLTAAKKNIVETHKLKMGGSFAWRLLLIIMQMQGLCNKYSMFQDKRIFFVQRRVDHQMYGSKENILEGYIEDFFAFYNITTKMRTKKKHNVSITF